MGGKVMSKTVGLIPKSVKKPAPKPATAPAPENATATAPAAGADK